MDTFVRPPPHLLFDIRRIWEIHLLILLLFSLNKTISSSCLRNDPTYDARQPYIKFEASPYPYITRQTNVTLTCEGRSKVEGSYISEIRLRKDKMLLTRCSAHYTQRLKNMSCTFVVGNINAGNKFGCTVDASTAPCNDVVLQFKISDPVAPKITSQQESVELNGVHLNCSATGYPEPLFDWILNDTDNGKHDRTNFELHNKTISTTSTINISHTGYPLRIQCHAFNEVNSAYSKIIYLGYIQVKIHKKSLNSIKITWRSLLNSNKSIISGYSLFLKSENESYVNKGPSNMSEASFDNLSFSTRYVFNLIGSFTNGDKLVSGAFAVLIKSPLPKPRSITVDKISLSSAVLHWEKIPPNAMHEEILGYRIVLTNQSVQLNFTTSSDKSKTDLENLSPGTTYTVAVRGYSEISEGLISDDKIFTTLTLLPKPGFVIFNHVNPSTVLIKWEQIPQNGKRYNDVLRYEIAVSNSSERRIFTTSSEKSELLLKDLLAETTYSVTVRGFNTDGGGRISDIKTFTTQTSTKASAKETNTADDSSNSLMIGLLVGGLVLVVLIGVALLHRNCRPRRKTKQSNIKPGIRNMNNPFNVNPQILYPDHDNSRTNSAPNGNINWEIPEGRLNVSDQILGGGYFGVVKRGVYVKSKEGENVDENVLVAVKSLKRNHAADSSELLRELDILKHVNTNGHQNIVGLVGACTATDPILVVLEYCSRGNLRDLLIDSRVCKAVQPSYKNLYSKLNETQLITFAVQIASGMVYLTEKKVIHRDIASRNILMDENLTPKIGDFGLARRIDTNEHYIVKKNKILPVKWMSLESLQEGKFTTASDIWSYGVLLWEICTLGEEPYPDVSPYDLLNFLKSGQRLTRPVHCSTEIFSLMESCWDAVPEKRPHFDVISNALQEILKDHERVYVNVIAESETIAEDFPAENDGLNVTTANSNSDGNDSGFKLEKLITQETIKTKTIKI